MQGYLTGGTEGEGGDTILLCIKELVLLISVKILICRYLVINLHAILVGFRGIGARVHFFD